MLGWNQDSWEKYQQPQICRWYHSIGRKWRRTKEHLDEVERGEWKSWHKIQHSKNENLGIQSHHFITNRWGKMETMTDFIFLGSKITVDGDCSHKMKRHFLLGRTVWQWLIPYNLATLFLSISILFFCTCAHGELHKNYWAKISLIAKREKTSNAHHV